MKVILVKVILNLFYCALEPISKFRSERESDRSLTYADFGGGSLGSVWGPYWAVCLCGRRRFGGNDLSSLGTILDGVFVWP